jgi:AraC family transcriptional activator of pobA
MRTDNLNIHVKTIADQHQLLDIAKPKHPLFSIIRFEDLPKIEIEERVKLVSDFYQVTLKKECPCKMQYGQNIFDFDEGVISCFAPKQVNFIDKDFSFATSGWNLSIHPDFLRSYALGQKIKGFGFFDYGINEALILSEDEQISVERIFESIEKEYNLPIDDFSQDVIISHIELLLSYCNRYYNRQFITRKGYNSDMTTKVEGILNRHFGDDTLKGLPTASFIANELNISSKYLSDCLKNITGQTTQQLIHEKLIESAKGLITSTELSVSEIAYKLGFEYPQSFSKFFKQKTYMSPLEYRKSFN